MNNIVFVIALIFLLCSALYAYLHKKTHMPLKYFFIDNLLVICLTLFLYIFFTKHIHNNFLPILIVIPLIPLIAFILTMIRFWHTPRRNIVAGENELVSPADGNIIYIKKIESGQLPVAVKNGNISALRELTKTDLLNFPCWLIGINMTPFDVHKNCAPVSGKIVLLEHFPGKFLSLKDIKAETENERQTLVIDTGTYQVAIVQIASKLVRRIDAYVKKGDNISIGQWYGMIRFGSQVDIIFPADFNVHVTHKQQVYAGTTIIASK